MTPPEQGGDLSLDAIRRKIQGAFIDGFMAAGGSNVPEELVLSLARDAVDRYLP